MIVLNLVLTTAVLSAVFSTMARVLAKRSETFGKPDAPVATYGGPAMLAALFCTFFWFPIDYPSGLIAGAMGMFWIGFVDDYRPFSPKAKLGLTILCAGGAVAYGLRLEMTPSVWFDGLVTLLWMVWLCHGFNVLDMEDGLSAGSGTLAALGLWCIGGGDWLLLLAGALLGFLVHNVYPSRLYMGDAGALTFGFVLSASAVLIFNVNGIASGVGAFVILGLPTFEAVFISVMRFAKGRPISRASRDHVAHRLEQWGRSVPVAVLMVWGIGLVWALLGYAMVMDWVAWWIGCVIGVGIGLVWGVCLARVDMAGDGVDGRLAGFFEKNWLIHRLMRVAMMDVAAYAKGCLLDVGCGNRPYEVLFAPHISNYVGLEYDPARYDRADLWGDAMHLPFEKDVFDTVISNQVLEHVPEPQQVINEFARVLRSDGCLILTAPHIWELHEVPHDYFRFTPYGLRYLAEKAGLEVIEIRALAGFWVTAGARFCYYLARFDRHLFKLLIRPLFFVVQFGALMLDRLHCVEGDAWNFLMVAQKK